MSSKHRLSGKNEEGIILKQNCLIY